MKRHGSVSLPVEEEVKRLPGALLGKMSEDRQLRHKCLDSKGASSGSSAEIPQECKECQRTGPTFSIPWTYMNNRDFQTCPVLRVIQGLSSLSTPEAPCLSGTSCVVRVKALAVSKALENGYVAAVPGYCVLDGICPPKLNC